MTPRKYQWPASALTPKDMAVLYDWRKQTGTPITELLRRAVQVCKELVEGGMNDDTPQR